MNKNKPTETGFEKMSDEELSRKVKHYENIERIGGKLIIVMIIALFLAAFLQDNVLIVLGLIAFIVLLMFLLPWRKRNIKELTHEYFMKNVNTKSLGFR